MEKTDSISMIAEQNNADPTLRYYEDHAEEFTANTIDADMKDIRSRFLSHLPAGARILDFGCGTGRDTKAFLDLAYEVAALDGSPSLCRIAGEYTGIPVQCMDFREYSPAEEIYAVNRQYPLVSFRRIRQRYGLGPVRSCLVHHHHRNMFPVMQELGKAMKAGAVLYASFKYGDREGERNGRYFTDFTPDGFREFMKMLPEFRLAEQWVTGDVRPGRGDERWLNMILERTEYQREKHT